MATSMAYCVPSSFVLRKVTVAQAVVTSVFVVPARRSFFSSSFIKNDFGRKNHEVPLWRLLAVSEDEEAKALPEKQPSKPVVKKVEARESGQKGQGTAIVTGAIAVVLGVAYLLLVQLLDSRGINLVPPPPEALEP